MGKLTQKLLHQYVARVRNAFQSVAEGKRYSQPSDAIGQVVVSAIVGHTNSTGRCEWSRFFCSQSSFIFDQVIEYYGLITTFKLERPERTFGMLCVA